MASFSISNSFTSFPLPKTQKYLQVRSQRLRDEGNSGDMVDANLSILRERIEEMKNKERLLLKKSNTYRLLENGWNNNDGYDETHKRRMLLAESFELVALVGSSFGLVFLGGSIFIFLLSLLLHLQIQS